MPPDSISVQTFKANGDSDYGFLTEKQKEVLALAVRRIRRGFGSDFETTRR